MQTAPYELIHQQLASTVAGLQFEVSIEKFKDYTLLEEKRISCGTSVKLELLDDIILDDVIEQFKGSVICSEIDTDIIIDGPYREVALLHQKRYQINKYLAQKSFLRGSTIYRHSIGKEPFPILI